MESTGPMTRSRMKGGGATPSAAPSTRKRATTTRSTRNPAAQAKDLASEPDDTITRADVADASKAQHQQDASGAGSEECEVLATVAAADTIAGLTPVPNNTSATPPGDYPGATPGTVGPSPVMPIKLDSLWTPAVPASSGRPSSTTATAGLGSAAGATTPSDGGVDLAAMFISTPAPGTAAAATSPVEGLVASSAEHHQQQQQEEDFAQQPFGGFAGAAATAAPELASAGIDEQMQQEEAEGTQLASFGSPAAVAAVEDATVTELEDDAVPSAPLLPISPAVLPAASPVPSCRTTPRRTPHQRVPALFPAAAAAAGSPLLGSPFPDDDEELPPAEDEYPEEEALMQEAAAEGLLLRSPAAPAVPAAFAADAGSEDGMAVDSEQKQSEEQQGQAGSEAEAAAEWDAAPDAAVEAEQGCSEGQEQQEESEELPPTDEGEAELLAEEAELAVLQVEMDVQLSAAKAADDMAAAAEEQQLDSAMEGCESPAAAEAAAAACPMPAGLKPAVAVAGTPAAAAAAAADLVVMNPEVVAALPVMTSPSRSAGSTTTTTAPPKSALVKPRADAASAGARKSAHVVVPGPSPKSSAKAVASSICSRQGADDGSSPGHTPYPSRAKVKAAAAAAAGSKADAAAATSSSNRISHKKDVGYARAHSALKQYANKSAATAAVTTPEQQQAGGVGGSPAKKVAVSPGVSSRLLQPTASYMAKTKAAAVAEADPLVWSPPLSPEASQAAGVQGNGAAAAAGPAAAAAAAGRPRLASKVVVPSPVAGSRGGSAGAAGGEPSLGALKRSIREKVAAKAQATLEEHHGSVVASKVRDVHEMRCLKPKAGKANVPSAAEPKLDFDDQEYEEDEQDYQGHDQDAAGALADSLAGLRVGIPQGPLRGVAAPVGRHIVFDDEGRPRETPCSKLRQAPRHTYFDDEGRPIQAPPARPVWR